MEYLYGTNSVLAALRAKKREYFSRLLYHGDLNDQIEYLANKLSIQTEKTEKHRLNIITNYAVHNGVVLETKPLPVKELYQLNVCDSLTGVFEYSEMFLDQPEKHKSKYLQTDKKLFPLGVYLDEVVDPHNIGSITRSAYFLGADFIAIASKNSASPSPIVSKVSSGAMEILPIFSIKDPLNFITNSQKAGGWTFITSCLINNNKIPKNKKNFVEMCDLKNMLQKFPVILVVGNEGVGVRTNVLNRSDFIVEIPFGRKGETKRVDSLNVGVSTSIILQSLLT